MTSRSSFETPFDVVAEDLRGDPGPVGEQVGANSAELDEPGRRFATERNQNLLGHESFRTTMDMYGTMSIDEMQGDLRTKATVGILVLVTLHFKGVHPL